MANQHSCRDPRSRERKGGGRLRMLVAIAVAVVVSVLHAEPREIDTEHSTLTVSVYKSGLFSALADNHSIEAPVAGGTVNEDSPMSVTIAVHAAALRVRDPNLSAGKRSEVQTRMVGPEVLDVARFPTIAFESTSIQPRGADSWSVSGRLTIHGEMRPVTFATTRVDGHYRGTVTLKQRDFGIMPISVAGGTVKVKDEIKIEFDVVPR